MSSVLTPFQKINDNCFIQQAFVRLLEIKSLLSLNELV